MSTKTFVDAIEAREQDTNLDLELFSSAIREVADTKIATSQNQWCVAKRDKIVSLLKQATQNTLQKFTDKQNSVNRKDEIIRCHGDIIHALIYKVIVLEQELCKFAVMTQKNSQQVAAYKKKIEELNQITKDFDEQDMPQDGESLNDIPGYAGITDPQIKFLAMEIYQHTRQLSISPEITCYLKEEDDEDMINFQWVFPSEKIVDCIITEAETSIMVTEAKFDENEKMTAIVIVDKLSTKTLEATQSEHIGHIKKFIEKYLQ